MINSTKTFEYDGKSSTTFAPGIINATLVNDMYEFAPLGGKSLIEQKIQGRDIPYFYNVDYDTLSFSMTIAFEDYATKSQVNEVIKWLYSPSTPRLLKFPEYEMNYFGLFIGEPRFYYVGNISHGFKYIGYIEVEFRANAPYGWTDIITGTTNTGDMDILPSFEIENNNVLKKITITNTKNNTVFSYNLSENEKINFNGYTKILTSDLTSNPYVSWNREYLVFVPGENTLTITSTDFPEPPQQPQIITPNPEITWSYRAPKIL